ncbi:unnamed protein product, partial [Thlaspi arvense]
SLKEKPDATVAKDGTGRFKTVQEAIAAAPEHGMNRYVIYVKQGIYDEVVRIGEGKVNITLVGDGSELTILSASLNNKYGYSTYNSATLGVDGDGFIGQDLWIRNTAGASKGQAVALRVSADRAILYRCRIEAFQDSLYAYKNRQFYKDTYISGTIDFICGDAKAVFQSCRIVARKPMASESNVITAQSANSTDERTGFIFHKCILTASVDLEPVRKVVKTYLGRPWGAYATVVFMKSSMGDLITPEGYTPWSVKDLGRSSTVDYREYINTGPGADTRRRVNWKGFGVIQDPEEAEWFTVRKFIQGDDWIRSTGVPYEGGL